ncbi:MAG TPA: DsrE/DsrF/DrsH-like family protein [Candidatus Hydrogenedentes bacterium]|nr:DsrE/DsrF/DrsH-like family protein [Candidatus Hydrogenedentota bacterium]HOV73470.1 DsrE/DsrF/DrsH-like family protein [Candidatus Hydrogenedentota bacterium]
MGKKVVIVGGVAGGMSCAARIKRLDDTMDVVVLERGPDVSFANCGMPYYIGGEIRERSDMLVQTVPTLEQRYRLDIRTRHEAVRIVREKKVVEVRNLESGETYDEPYDVLVLSPGASPVRPPIPGADGPKVHVLNHLGDMDAIAAVARNAKKATVIGAGFIGLELVENLRRLGLEVALIELLDQVLPPFDREMTQPLLQELRLNKVDVRLGKTVAFMDDRGVQLKNGARIESDFVCLCTGVRPNTELAREAGLELGARGHIRVDETMRTSDPAIYAVGDAVETADLVTGEPSAFPLAGPANRQARIAADAVCGRASSYRGTQGTAIVRVFSLTAACTGWNEKKLRQAGMPYRRAFLHPMQHPRYYPNAQPIGVKILFSPEGKILGAQAVGAEGADVLINTIATAMRAGVTVQDLEQLELAYSPQYGGAKHGINMIGYVASNILNGDMETIEPDEEAQNVQWIDVRNPAETECGMLPNAILVPLDELRTRADELPRDRELGVYCAVGLRGYIAYRILKQMGFKARNLNGGYRTWTWYHKPDAGSLPASCGSGATKPDAVSATSSVSVESLDCTGMQCPGPLLRVKEAVSKLAAGQEIEVVASDPGFAADVPSWCKRTGNTLRDISVSNGRYVARIAKGEAPVPASGGVPLPGNKKTIVCFSNDLDRALAAFVIANGAAAMGDQVTIFFTFWGLNILRREKGPSVTKGFLDRMFGMMMPKGADRLKLSKLNMAGIGTMMMKHVMRTKNVLSLPELMASAKANGIRLVACSMSMDVMGIKREELIDGVEIAGVGNYLGEATESNVNLFI